jgi:Ca2+-transporting ATPase
MNQNDDAGLSAPEAAQRLRQDGPNALPSAQRRKWRHIARETLQEPMFMLLLAAGTLYLLLGDLHEGLVLFGLVLVVLAMTLYQEGKTERALDALRDLSSPRAMVLRDGQPVRIAGHEVVCGDVLLLAEGDRIAADVEVDESLLTGEAVPVDKGGHDALFSGTLLVRGHGRARVTATGERSEIGRIGHALGTLGNEPSPLKQQTAHLLKVLALLALAASVLLVLAHGWIRGDWMAALLAGIALAMAMLPQELTVVLTFLTVLPALGAWHRKMS